VQLIVSSRKAQWFSFAPFHPAHGFHRRATLAELDQFQFRNWALLLIGACPLKEGNREGGGWNSPQTRRACQSPPTIWRSQPLSSSPLRTSWWGEVEVGW